MGAAAGAMALGLARPGFAAEDPSAALYPAKANPAYADAQRPVTDAKYATTFNNYYEFGSSKRIASAAEKLPVRPWEVVIDGEVEKPITIGIDDLLKQVTLEERIYRHRCVEAWSMVVPWTGFTVKSLVEIAKPNSNAKFLRFETFNKPDVAPGQKEGFFTSYPWPYVEGITHCRGHERLAADGDRRLRQAASQQHGRTLAAAPAVEIRLQVHQGHRAGELHRGAPGELLGNAGAQRNMASGPM